MPSINEVMKSRRTRKGMSQTQVADKLKVSSQTISNFERGASGLPLKTILRLCKIYDLPRVTARKILVEDYANKVAAVIK